MFFASFNASLCSCKRHNMCVVLFGNLFVFLLVSLHLCVFGGETILAPYIGERELIVSYRSGSFTVYIHT